MSGKYHNSKMNVRRKWACTIQFALLLFSAWATVAYSIEWIPAEAGEEGIKLPASGNCPSGYFKTTRLHPDHYGVDVCIKFPEGPRYSSQPASPKALGCRNNPQLRENFRWSFIHNPQQAGIMLRAIDQHDYDALIAAYKQSQSHNQNAANMVDSCNPSDVWLVAHDVAESKIRLRACNQRAPAASATCNDVMENLRWSMVDAGACAPFARQRALKALDGSSAGTDRDAAWVRRAMRIAQGHNQQVADSVLFVSDQLLLELTRKVIDQYRIRSLPAPSAGENNPFIKQSCPGLAKENALDPAAGER